MHILFLNPYHGGSHAAVAEGYAAHSRHCVTLLTLPIAAGWRWRMRGAAVTMARLARAQPAPDLIITTDMLDLATFRALYGNLSVPAAIYFHENQLTYPLPEGRSRDLSFAWTNYTSTLAADAVFFNSTFHRRSFLAALPGFLGRYHDYQELETIRAIAAKSHLLPPGVDFKRLEIADWGLSTGSSSQSLIPNSQPPIILWNSRWEYDKQPQAFFAALGELEACGAEFRLIVAGEHVDPNAPEFVAARRRWSHRIVHWGYAADLAAYAGLLYQADIVVSTALQEFFGIAILEALYCGCIPILPNRLSYPELLPAAYHANCLYNTPDQLIELLAQALLHCDELRGQHWRSIAAPYDWTQMGPQYDAAFEALM